MLDHVDTIHHTLAYRCEHCYEQHPALPLHPDEGHVQVLADRVLLTCPSCRGRSEQGQTCPECRCTHGHTVEIFLFDYLTDEDAGWVEPEDSLVGTVLEGGNVVVLDDRNGTSNPFRRRQAQLILTLLRHPHIVTARDVARKSQD